MYRMDAKKVLDLAKLARIEIGYEEAESLSHEFDAILGYVGEVKGVSKADNLKLKADSFPIRNIMRNDKDPHETSFYTENILGQAPAREGNYIRVKKIL
ncbi:MAG: hypothetical protein A3C70_00140 [Candidatus Zambryskibacteria bacterium RIFCSPHIGHO2_02_FULL_43_14]|uniref:Aspartyl/glutamyl-tRNA(Asn/Gln) amidotransferase subunit C n=1 Tax=Candidatus Zambryskibacteria bacterium RIFCSPHIGHO2_02_FULL_43_14 TaxID=1802748 RepID=A0A1G2TF66_9BACT|nr:MAG: hypothetical protein A2829_03190 [Candidatus Zambryskibacteria bacterium RIFCSPHIGHO2_01_FULL_43_60]OHA95883.1 MAG: hypothetical protein A3C70_00140 [Candidatus Zambryskibacteria bacterium RIFCSPHIGHO2_02_FULL_43_14]OHB03423.1 MAG: hypothetical protein A3B03_02320 [Candidatus Zambryskibacteria bacterium RIFCSPLOWO2_01_FULL_42_41]